MSWPSARAARAGLLRDNGGVSQANDKVAALIEEYADLYVMTGGDPFRARVYSKAARALAAQTQDVTELSGPALLRIPGVGKSIAAKVGEISTTGTFAELEELRADIPDGVRQLTRIPALGPRRALQLYHELQISSPDQLRDAIAAGQLNDLKGFGPKSTEKLLRGLDLLATAGGRVLLNVAAETAASVIEAVSAVGGCQRIAPAGSLRRAKESIGDVDVLAAADDSAPLMAALTAMPDAAEVIAAGPAKTSIRTAAGLQVDLRVVALDAWGAAMQYFTGSQEHNVRIRELAVRRKLKLSEYGLFDTESGELIVSRTEEEVYQRLGMQWIPPTLREDTGEVAAALKGELPELVTLPDVRGDLHSHTNLTDGTAPLADMVAAARDSSGYEYYAITDHAPDLVMQRMTDEKMLAQREQVRQLAAELMSDGGRPMVLLHGTELNIAPDGSVDWPASFLAGFDVCVASRALTLRSAARGHDPQVPHGLREPLRQRHRAPAHPQDRPPPAGRRRPGRAVQGLRPDRHGAGGQLASGPAGPAVRAHQGGPRRGREVRHRHRLALAARPDLFAVRRRDGAARLAHAGRRDQHLAAGPAD